MRALANDFSDSIHTIEAFRAGEDTNKIEVVQYRTPEDRRLAEFRSFQEPLLCLSIGQCAGSPCSAERA